MSNDDAVLGASAARLAVDEAMTALALVEAVFKKENEVLSSGRMKVWRGLLQEKESAVQTYAALFVKLRRTSVALKRFQPEKLEELRERHARFLKVLRKNEAILSALRGVAETVLLEVARELGEASPQAYGPDARKGSEAPALRISHTV